jgi:hypothetical protein
MNPTDADWWWQYGLDGIVGGVVGGLVTGLAVVLTLRHERRLAARTELRASVARLQGIALRLTFNVPDRWDEDLPENADAAERSAAESQFDAAWADWRTELWSELNLTEALASEIDSRLARLLSSASEQVHDHFLDLSLDEYDPRLASALTADLHAYLFKWLADPKSFRRMSKPDWGPLVAEN